MTKKEMEEKISKLEEEIKFLKWNISVLILQNDNSREFTVHRSFPNADIEISEPHTWSVIK